MPEHHAVTNTNPTLLLSDKIHSIGLLEGIGNELSWRTKGGGEYLIYSIPHNRALQLEQARQDVPYTCDVEVTEIF